MKAIAKMKLDTEQTMKLEELYVVGSDGELNSWLDRSFSLEHLNKLQWS